MAGDSRLSVRWAALLVASVLLAALSPAIPLPEGFAPQAATALQTEDTGAVSAFVADDFGRPIASAVITVLNTNLTGTTGLDGYALIEHLPADPNGTDYTLYASKAGYVSSELMEVTLTPWNTEDVSLEIRGGILYGLVEDAVGPVAGAVVTISTLGYSNTTNMDGVYSIYGVPGGGTYAVTAAASGYNNQTKEAFIEVGGFTVLEFLMVSLTGAISGTVTHATTDEALFNASVSVRVGTVMVTATTDADGTYRIPDLPSGTYSVTAWLEGFEASTISGITVSNGIETEGIDFHLAEKSTKLYGIVRSGTFLVPGVLITVLGTGLSTNTSIEGYYEITNITVGTHTLTASLEGYNTVTVEGIVIARGGQTQVNINMTSLPGPSLSGTVFSTHTNDVLSGVAVTVLGQGTQRSTITNTEGQFVVPGLTMGNYTVRFYLDGYKPLEMSPVFVPESGLALGEVQISPVPESFGGFIFGFDLAHSMMILALFLTIIILALAVMLRVRSFEAPEKAPAIYDQEGEDEPAERETEPRKEKDREHRKKDKKRK